MAQSNFQEMWCHFEHLEDPRDQDRNFQHSLKDVLILTIVGFCCGMKSLEACAHFARMQEKWFKEHLDLPHGIPSHDTFRRVFQLVDVEALQAGFTSWGRALHTRPDGDVIPIDGKTVRRSGGNGQKALHVVSAWTKANGIVLGQISVEEKTNEITAIPKLIESLAIHGCVVTIDAMGCQTEIVDAVIEKGANYLLTVKGNQPTLFQEMKNHFEGALPENSEDSPYRFHEESDKGHGRLETRQIWTSSQVELIFDSERWQCLNTLVRVDSERLIKGKATKESRYYITSLNDAPETILDVIRSHWQIENKLHWCLDVTMGEDNACLRDRLLAENGSTIRRVSLNLLRSHPDFKGNLAAAMRSAGFDLAFREKLMNQILSNA